MSANTPVPHALKLFSTTVFLNQYHLFVYKWRMMVLAVTIQSLVLACSASANGRSYSAGKDAYTQQPGKGSDSKWSCRNESNQDSARRRTAAVSPRLAHAACSAGRL